MNRKAPALQFFCSLFLLVTTVWSGYLSAEFCGDVAFRIPSGFGRLPAKAVNIVCFIGFRCGIIHERGTAPHLFLSAIIVLRCETQANRTKIKRKMVAQQSARCVTDGQADSWRWNAGEKRERMSAKFLEIMMRCPSIPSGRLFRRIGNSPEI